MKDTTMEWRCFLVVLMIINSAFAITETLQTFDPSMATGFKPTDVEIYDKDGNGIEPTVVKVSGLIVVKTTTMPLWNSPDAPSTHEDNYVFLPHISNPSGNEMVELKYTYNHRAVCHHYNGRTVQCKNYIMLYLVPVASTVNVRTIDVLANNVGAYNLSMAAGDVNGHHFINFPPSTQGYRLVFHDEGSEFDVHTLTLTSHQCRYQLATNMLPIHCRDTYATNNRSIPIQCTCTDPNSTPNSTRATIEEHCHFDQSTSSASFSRAPKDVSAECKCNPGYDYSRTQDGSSRYCKIKPSTTSTTTISTTTSTPHASKTTKKGPSSIPTPVSSATAKPPFMASSAKTPPGAGSTHFASPTAKITAKTTAKPTAKPTDKPKDKTTSGSSKAISGYELLVTVLAMIIWSQ